MRLQYCSGCGLRVDSDTATILGDRVYCTACARKLAPQPQRKAPQSRAPLQTAPRAAAAGQSARRQAGDSAANAGVRSSSSSHLVVAAGVLLAMAGVFMLAFSRQRPKVAEPSTSARAASKTPPGAPLAPPLGEARTNPEAQPSPPAAHDTKVQAPVAAEPQTAGPDAQPRSAFLVTEMEDMRESSAQRELDGLLEMEKSGKTSPFELRARYQRLVASRGSTKAGKVAAEKLRNLPELRTEANLAVGKPVTASSQQGGHPASCAVDGNISLDSAWWADPYPQWLKVDLEKVASIATIRIFLYWGDGRYYQYTLEVSKDDKEWRTVVDQSANTQPSTPEGHIYSFPPADVRYVRVNMLKNSANPGVHVVELQIFPPQ
ncbi:MAG: discoidin domain-containing protein [Planctomycetota bacterium]